MVNLSSLAHRGGKIDLEDFQGERYRPWKAYQQSRLAMLMFAIELQRRSDANGWGLMSNAAHPGYARTDLIPNGRAPGGAFAWMSRVLGTVMSHSAAQGALPQLLAATSPEAQPAAYDGPDGFYELKGPPVPARIMPPARDAAMAAKLWALSEKLTGVTAA